MKKLAEVPYLLGVLLYCVFIAAPANAQETSLESEPGYVHFSDLAKEYGEAKVEINLGGAMLGFVSSMAKNDDPKMAEVISKLKGVRVRIFDTKGNLGPALDEVNRVSKILKKNDWQAIVSVKEKEEQVRIYSKLTEGVMDGLMVMVANNKSNETVFINIVGAIDPAQIGAVAKSLNVDMGI
jgi:Domain of unknown function (DUF4252)